MLTLRADWSLVASKSAHASPYLPDGKLDECSTEIERGLPLRRTFSQIFWGAKVRHNFHTPSSFHNNRSFFNGKDALQISIRSLVYSAPGAVRATEVLPCSNIQPDFRSLSLNRSNLEPIYQIHHGCSTFGNWAECSTESASSIEFWAQCSIRYWTI